MRTQFLAHARFLTIDQADYASMDSEGVSALLRQDRGSCRRPWLNEPRHGVPTVGRRSNPTRRAAVSFVRAPGKPCGRGIRNRGTFGGPRPAEHSRFTRASGRRTTSWSTAKIRSPTCMSRQKYLPTRVCRGSPIPPLTTAAVCPPPDGTCPRPTRADPGSAIAERKLRPTRSEVDLLPVLPELAGRAARFSGQGQRPLSRLGRAAWCVRSSHVGLDPAGIQRVH